MCFIVTTSWTFKILDRTFDTSNVVTVSIKVDDKPQAIVYELIGAEWKFAEPDSGVVYLGSLD